MHLRSPGHGRNQKVIKIIELKMWILREQEHQTGASLDDAWNNRSESPSGEY